MHAHLPFKNNNPTQLVITVEIVTNIHEAREERKREPWPPGIETR